MSPTPSIPALHPLLCFLFIAASRCFAWGSGVNVFGWHLQLRQGQIELLGCRGAELRELLRGCLSVAGCRHYCVVMGAHERVPSCSLVLLMTKGVKCIFTSGGPFGRFPRPLQLRKVRMLKIRTWWKSMCRARTFRAMWSNPSVFGHLEGNDPGTRCLFGSFFFFFF